MRNQRGITLIALVITIIVLLILAGVSIAMLTGDNGILTKSNQAKEETVMGEAADKINLAINAEYANILADKKMSGATGSGTTTIGDKAEIASKNGITEADFEINVATSLEETTDPILEIRPKAGGAYGDYATDSNLVGTITYSTTEGYKIDKAEVVYPIVESDEG